MEDLFEAIKKGDDWQALNIFDDKVKLRLDLQLQNYSQKEIEEKVNFNYINEKSNSSLLTLACDRGLHKITEKLLDDNVNLDVQNCYGVTALMYLTGRGMARTKMSLIDKIISQSPNLDLQNEDSNTALMFACFIYGGNEEIAIKLIDAGADLELFNHKKYTAIDYMHKYKLTKVLDHIMTIKRIKILEAINDVDHLMYQCFCNQISDLNVVDIIVCFIDW